MRPACAALFALVIASSAEAVSRKSAPSPVSANPYLHSTWSPDEGLPETAVKSLSRGPDGLLWITGTETVSSFDGQKFSLLQAFSRLPCNSVLHAFPDQAGRVWIATRNCGVLVYDHGDIRYCGTDRTGPNVISFFAETSDGTLWAVMAKGLARRVGEHFERVPELAEESIVMISRSQGTSLLATTRASLFHIDGTKVERDPNVTLQTSSEEGMIHHDTSGAIWMGMGDEGLYRLNPDGKMEHFTDKDGLPGNSVRAAAVDEGGTLWFATNRGLARYDQGKFTGVIQGTAEQNIQTVVFDIEGNLFYGTYSGGLHQLRLRTVWMVLEGLTDPSSWAVYEDRAGALWVGTEQAGLHRFHDGKVDIYTPADGLPDTMTTSIYEARNGELWVGTLGGLWRRRLDGTSRTYGMEDGLPTMRTHTVVEDDDGTLYVGTGDALMRLQGERFVQVELPAEVAHARVRHIIRDGPRGLWIGTAAGLIRWDGKESQLFGTAQGLGSSWVASLMRDSRGDIWVGTTNGLSRIRGDKVSTAQMKDGLLDRNIMAVREDRDGNLWIGSLSGVWRVLRSDIEAFFDGRQPSIDTMILGVRDGMVSPEVNNISTSASMVGKDGRIYFVTMAGVAVVDPAAFQERAHPLRPQVTEIVRDKERLTPEQLKAFEPGTRDLEFNYTAPAFRDPRMVRFRYRLQGYDNKWVEAGARRQAFYTQLRPGSYRFEVMARSKEGIWSKAPATVNVALEPYFYETTWFAVLMVATGLMLAAGAYAWRMRVLQQRQRELVRRNQELAQALEGAQEAAKLKGDFVANISHELRTPLNSIINVPEGLLDGLSTGVPTAGCQACNARFALEDVSTFDVSTPCPDCGREALKLVESWEYDGGLKSLVDHLRDVVRSGRHMLHVVDDVLDFSRLNAGQMTLHFDLLPVRMLMEDLRATMSGLAEKKDVTLEFIASEELVLKVDRVKCTQVFLNLISNAVKFSHPGSTVQVGADAGPEGFMARMWVRDTGVGIAPEHHTAIFESFRQVDNSQTRSQGGTGLGLAISRELVELHGGRITLESAVGAGSTFWVTLPLEGAELDVPEEAPAIKRERPLVLALDDDEVSLETLRLSLRALELDVETLTDPAKLIAAVEERQPELIMLDIMMPNISGLTLLKELSASPRTKHLRVLVSSAYHSHRDAVLSMGASWVSKPWVQSELLSEVRRRAYARRRVRPGDTNKPGDGEPPIPGKPPARTGG